MDWFLLSITSSILISLVSVFDKRILEADFPSVRAFIFVLGTIWWVQGILILSAVIFLSGLPDVGYMLLACVAGATTASGLSFYFWGLTFEEVSRGSPIFGTSPLFSAILSIVFLAEKLIWIQWMGIIAIVIGASLLSFKPTPGRREFIGKKGFGVFLAGALFAGSGLVLNKQASYGLPVVPLFGAYSLGIACAFTIYSIRPTTLRQVACVVRDRAKMRLFLIAELGLGPVAIVCLQMAVKLGPASMIGAVLASRALFVLIFSSLLSTRFWKILDEPLDSRTLGLKSFSTVLIVLGLTGLALY